MTQLAFILLLVCLFLIVMLLMPGVRNGIDNLISNRYPWVMVGYFLVGIICYAVSCYIAAGEETRNAEFWLQKAGDLFLLGVFWGVITHTSRFADLFKKNVIDEFYSSKHLMQRKDIQDIWLNVSKTLMKDKYPKISASILKIIKDVYFPTKVKGYYDNYQVDYHISFVDEQKEYIRSRETISYTYKQFIKTPKYERRMTCRKSQDDAKVQLNLISFKIDGNDVTQAVKLSQEYKDGKITKNYQAELPKKDNDDYRIEIQLEKIYRFNEDFDLTFSSRCITNNLQVELNYTSDFYAYLMPSGVPGNFTTTLCEHYLKAQYSGVMFPKQGFTILLRRAEDFHPEPCDELF